MRLLFLFFAIASIFSVSGCAHTEIRSTGIPASSAENFYFNMEQVALEKGYSTTHGEAGNRELTITLPKGYLYYGTGGGNGVEARASVGKIDGESKADSNVRLDKVWAIHNELIEKARALSKKNETFR